MHQIIYLQPEEDLAAIRAQIEMAELAHVVLVVPPDCPALASRAGLQLLRRAADDLGVQVALVAHHPFVRVHGAEFGFPIFTSIPQAQRAHWRMEPPRQPGTRSPTLPPTTMPETTQPFARLREWRATLLVIAIIMLGLGVAAFFLIPAAQIRLVPSAVALTTTTDVTIDSSIVEVNVATRAIPARRLNREISGTLSLRTTITKTIPDARSTGVVTFTNLREEETVIPPGTIVKTSAGVPIRFTTTTTVTLPAGVNSRVDAPIQAVDPGSAGNVKELAINTVEGSLALSVRVINTKPTVSGTLRSVKVVTADDKKKVEEQLLQELKKQAPAVLNANLKPGEMLLPDSILVDIEDRQFDHAVDEPADALTLKATANAFGLAIDREDLNAVMQLLLEKQLQAGYRLLPNGVKVETQPGGKFQGIQLRQPIRAVGYAIPQIDPAKVAVAVQGKSVEEAKALLASRLALAQPAEIRVMPPLWFRMPWLAFRIAVFVDEPLVNP
jgi:hypothetical protein